MVIIPLRQAGESTAEFYHAIRAEGFSVFVIEDAPQAGRLAVVSDAMAAAALDGVNLLLSPAFWRVRMAEANCPYSHLPPRFVIPHLRLEGR
jgi:hypothetical protein